MRARANERRKCSAITFADTQTLVRGSGDLAFLANARLPIIKAIVAIFTRDQTHFYCINKQNALLKRIHYCYGIMCLTGKDQEISQ